MTKDINFYLAIAGCISGVVGAIGTYYQILEFTIIWIALLVLGFAILLALLFFYKELIGRSGINHVYKNQEDAED